MTNEQDLIDKLRRIETLFARAATEGERVAAGAAADRVRQRLKETRQSQAIEFKFTHPDAWSKALFIALLRRHGIRPYRYPGQRHTTVMARVPTALVDEEIWPEFQELHKTLQSYLNEVTQRVIAAAIHDDVSEPEIRGKAQQLTLGDAVDLE
jgi:hypothetical protein